MSDPIKKVTLKDGTTRYRFVVDVGRDPTTHRRIQKKHTYDTKKDARVAYDRIRHETNSGTYLHSTDITVSQYLSGWVDGATRELRPNSKASYLAALRPAHDYIGEILIQEVTRSDIESLVTWMLNAGRRRGGTPGTGLGPRSVRITLGRLSAAFETALREGLILRNVVKLVRPPSYRPPARRTWYTSETRTFLSAAAEHRLHAGWRLSLYGLRRGEVLGLRWTDDVDFGSFGTACRKHSTEWCSPCYGKKRKYRVATITIQQTRILVGTQVTIGEPKSTKSRRRLPLDRALAVALRELRQVQLANAERLRSAYINSGYVVVDEIGRPVHPEWYSNEFRRLAAHAGVPDIMLHEGRHTTLSLMEKAGVPISIVSAWAGHHSTAFTYSTYVHATEDDLRAGVDALATIHRLDQQYERT